MGNDVRGEPGRSSQSNEYEASRICGFALYLGDRCGQCHLRRDRPLTYPPRRGSWEGAGQTAMAVGRAWPPPVILCTS